MSIKIERNNGVTVLIISGNVRIGNEDVEMRKTFKARLDEGDRQFLFDMTGIGYIDSAGISETVACYKRAKELGGAIKVLLKAKGKPEEVFQITNLDRVLEIHYDRDAALASF